MSVMPLALILLAAALVIGGGIWVAAARDRSRVRGRFAEAFGDDVAADGYDETGMNRLVARMERRQAGEDFKVSEFRTLLHRAGWSSRNARATFYLLLYAVPAVAVAGAAAWVAFGRGEFDLRGIVIVFIAFVAGFEAPRIGIRMLASSRGERLAREAPIWARLLAMLLESGLNIEQALRSMLADSADVLPESYKEISWILRRLDAGASLPDALGDWQKVLGVPELSDLASLLQQVSRFGGNARGPLLELANAIEQRQLSTIKERINKLAVKMTVVMMTLLFPALLVVLAGPGFLALGRALSNVGR